MSNIERTSIVTDKNGKFLIAKRITINNAQINHEVHIVKQ
jgi:phosphatidate phosphatase APP1